jgi:hypothetical protein
VVERGPGVVLTTVVSKLVVSSTEGVDEKEHHDGRRMTAADVVARVMAGEHGDFVPGVVGVGLDDVRE